MSKRRRSRFDPSALPIEQRRRIAAEHPELSEAVGIAKTNGHKPAPKKAAGSKPHVGTIRFDSLTEAACYQELCQQHPAVIAHGMIALSEESHMEPDFVIVEEILPDGRFVGRLADAKAVWRGKTAAHAERDWKVKAKWLKAKLGLIVDIVTREGRKNAPRDDKARDR